MNGSPRSKVFSVLNLHLGGLALLLVLDLFLGVKLFLAWRTAGADREEQIAQAQITLAQLQSQGRRLNDLPVKVERARSGAAEFYSDRLPANYSSIAGALGDLYVHDGVRLTRASYTQKPSTGDLAEITIDANVSGEYTALMRFLNGLERSRTFFVINTLTLTGQQGGLVNLRLRMTTYMRAANAGGIPTADEASPQAVVEAVR